MSGRAAARFEWGADIRRFLIEALRPLVGSGATHLIPMLACPYPDGIVARLADEVVARVG
jgi:hypothetical protein